MNISIIWKFHFHKNSIKIGSPIFSKYPNLTHLFARKTVDLIKKTNLRRLTTFLMVRYRFFVNDCAWYSYKNYIYILSCFENVIVKNSNFYAFKTCQTTYVVIVPLGLKSQHFGLYIIFSYIFYINSQIGSGKMNKKQNLYLLKKESVNSALNKDAEDQSHELVSTNAETTRLTIALLIYNQRQYLLYERTYCEKSRYKTLCFKLSIGI